ncbi:MAG: Glucose--fructose oxidoreductase precursor [candidate division BRC1 bacterium ADurb.BinA364]|nr:MAG: Glucose--fructose oxidoreductase precursor [candidate division BRC1 bacterium ADurb.BinA364]
MAKIERIGIIGLVHDHIWNYLDPAKTLENCRIVCAADVHAALRERVAAELALGPEALYADWRAMLEKESLDACLVFAETALHAEATEACAARGLHVMAEKPMARTVEEADRMIAAARKAGTRLMINFPIMWNPDMRGLIDAVLSGAIGRVWMIHYRDGHKGPRELGCSSYFCDWLYDREKNGGGALMDFCVYGASVTARILGRPSSVYAVSGNLVKKDLAVEDNGVITARFGQDAIAIIEGTWTQVAQGHSISFFGEKGSIASSAFGPREYTINTPGEGARKLAPATLPPGEDKPIPYFVKRIREDRPFEGIASAENARIAQEILGAAFASIAADKPVALA